MKPAEIINSSTLEVLLAIIGSLHITRVLDQEAFLNILDYLELDEEFEKEVILKALNTKPMKFTWIDMRETFKYVDRDCINRWLNSFVETGEQLPMGRINQAYFIASDIETLQKEINKL